MPPEPLPWDRKDFFKERKHERSCSDSLAGAGCGSSGGGGPSVSRWRDSPYHHGSSSSRWGSSSDFRRPSGHGKQGGAWHMFTEESGGVSRGVVDVKYCRNSSRENNRALFNSGQKDWKGHSWEMTASPNGNSHPDSDFVNSWDQLHLKEQQQHNKNNGGVVSNYISNTGQRFERENSLNSIDWKPLKWSRSGSLSSRGSGFSHSSNSKSIGGVDSVETKVEAQPGNATPLQSPLGDAAPCVTSRAPPEETGSRKKPRLGWGEGLAKYEKKKVEGPDEIPVKDTGSKGGMADAVGTLEPMHHAPANLVDKSPICTGYSDCASPTTPSSFACSSSPGVEDKPFKAATVNNDVSNPSASACAPQNQYEGFSFNLENMELSQLVNLSSLLNELLQCDDQSSVSSGFVRSSAMDKLQVWKADISKKLEVTESEIDSLENELKSIGSDCGGACPCPADSSSLPPVCSEIHYGEKCHTSISRPSPWPLRFISSGDMSMERPKGALEEDRVGVKDEDIDSPGTATSKFMEPLSLRKDAISHVDAVKHSDSSVHLDIGSKNVEVNFTVAGVSEEISGVVTVSRDDAHLPANCSSAGLSIAVGVPYAREDKLCDLIFSTNRDLANKASETLDKLLPTNQCHVDVSRSNSGSCSQSETLIKEKFAKKKRFLRFKERIITLKYQAFQYLWKEDLLLLSVRRSRAKSQKKLELSLRTVHSVCQKSRSSIRARFSSPVGNLRLVPTADMINYTNKLLSDSQVRVYRNTMKMPSLILDKRERATTFISQNGLVEDPCAVEKERSVINPWTSEEKDIFMDKFAIFGKDFKKIASFLENKTIADCVEFYYKNHKSDCFQKTKKNPEFRKQSANAYLVTSGKRWNRETNTASLDMLGAVSAIAANVDESMENQRKSKSKFYIGGTSSEYKLVRGEDGILERSSSLVDFGNERETAAADVLAGICGSISSEALSSCTTSSIDPGDYHQDWRCQKVGDTSKRRPLTPEVTQNDVDDETCSDESYEEVDPADWSDEEKAIFIQAVASYGKDFAKISRCVRTRSTDQCKVFFSKARKCLGLDGMRPEPCSEGTNDANGGNGIDPDDACMVESGTVTCKVDDEDLKLTGSKVESFESDSAIAANYPDPTLLDNSKDAEVRSEKSVLDECEDVNKPKVDFAGDTNMQMCTPEETESEVGEAPDGANLAEAPEMEEREQIVIEEVVYAGETTDACPPSTSGADVESEAIDEVSAKHSSDEIERGIDGLPSESRSVVNDSETSGSNSCPAEDLNSAPQSCGDGNSLQFVVENGDGLWLDVVKRPSCGSSLEQNNCFIASNSLAKELITSAHQRAVSQDDMSTKLSFRKSSDRLSQKSASTDGYYQHLPSHSLMDCVESTQILRAYPVTVSTSEGMNVDLSCNEPAASIQSIPKPDRNLQLDSHITRDCFLQRCNGLKHDSLVPDVPLLSQEQKRSCSSSSDVEKPCRSGDVKLFGQILTHPSSQQQKTNGSIIAHEKCDSDSNHAKLNGGKFFNNKFDGNHSSDKNLALPTIDRNNYFGAENSLPMRSYGFWDGNRIQTGFPSLPDSTILLAKYPAAFGNCSTPSKMEQQPLHSALKTLDRNSSAVSSFQGRETSSSNRLGDYVYRRSELQPFTVDKLRQDFLLSEMQRRKDSEPMVSGIQQQGRGVVGINVVGREGGILVGGTCNGVSDPVAAIKMHYAKAEQFNVREAETWRSNGDIGR